MSSPSIDSGQTGAKFQPTEWSLVRRFQGEGDTPVRAEALEQLCAIYWPPVYGYIRRRGLSPHDAEDLTQGFFSMLLKRESLEHLAPESGRFRTFLLKALKRFMADEYRKATAKKRHPGSAVLPLDCGLAEEGFVADPGHHVTPALEFERQWAIRIVSLAREETRQRYLADGHEARFVELEGILKPGGTTDPYVDIAERLGMSVSAVKQAARRLRIEFRDQIRALVAATVSDPVDLEPELRHLQEVFHPPRAW